MKDYLILLLLVVALVYTLRQPWVGAMVWALVSLMSPHAEFGYAAASWPVAAATAGCTLLGLLLTKDRQNPFIGAASYWLLGLMIWVTVTLPASFTVEESLPLWERSMKIWFMTFVSMALITTRHKLVVFVWINVIAIGYYGVKGGAFTILTGGNYRVWGPGGFIEGNNEVALAVISVIPLMRFLQLQQTSRWVRLGFTGAIGLSALMALGTYSRGALLGLTMMLAVFWWRSPNKLVWGLLILVIAAVAASLMPAQWWERMDTIKSYEADGSAMGRINAWWMAFNLARDMPLGGGFMSWVPELFARYAPVPDSVHAAHSIYFQMLGEHGFVGLFLFLAIGVSTWLTARSLMRTARGNPELRWAGELGAMIQVSMVGYGTAGAFLSLAYFDLPYNVMMMAVLGQLLARQQLQAAVARSEAVPAMPAPVALNPGTSRQP